MGTKIEWTHFEGFKGETWNPIVGCDQISAGCGHCYAKTLHDKRHKAYMAGNWDNAPSQYRRVFEEVTFIPGRVANPLHWRMPRAVFVNSVSDIFHEAVSLEEIAAIFAVMGASPRHIFILLTKRHERMVTFFELLAKHPTPYTLLVECAREHLVGKEIDAVEAALTKARTPWPFENVIVGVSVENQGTANVRVPAVLKVPAAVRFISYEPALGPVFFGEDTPEGLYRWLDGIVETGMGNIDPPSGHPTIGWVVVGGESGRDVRGFDVEWARDTIAQCAAAGVPCFVKQLGAKPYSLEPARTSLSKTGWGHREEAIRLRNPKGVDPSEWPAGLHVREFPVVATR